MDFRIYFGIKIKTKDQGVVICPGLGDWIWGRAQWFWQVWPKVFWYKKVFNERDKKLKTLTGLRHELMFKWSLSAREMRSEVGVSLMCSARLCVLYFLPPPPPPTSIRAHCQIMMGVPPPPPPPPRRSLNLLREKPPFYILTRLLLLSWRLKCFTTI